MLGFTLLGIILIFFLAIIVSEDTSDSNIGMMCLFMQGYFNDDPIAIPELDHEDNMAETTLLHSVASSR